MPAHIARPRRQPNGSPRRGRNISNNQDQGHLLNRVDATEKAGSRTIVHQPITALASNGRNARTHDPRQIAQIAASMRQFGFTIPILIDDTGTVLAGHARLAAAKELGLQTVPTITLAGLSDAEKRAYGLADNRLAEKAGWNDQILGERSEERRVGKEGRS